MKKRTRPTWIIAAVGSASALAAFAISLAAGKAGDCKPHQVDGQCGLSTFLGIVYGGVAAVVIVVATVILFSFRIMREQARAKREPADE